MHAIWTFPVNTRWLKDVGRACGFGFMNQIGRRGHVDEAIGSVAEVGQYVAKYLGKQLGDELPPRFRRVRTSANWAKLPIPDPADKLEWCYVNSNGALQSAYERCAADNLTMIDIRTGEIFDDVNLGTIIYA